MFDNTVEAVAVLAIAFLPGALYLWALESVVGGWWLSLSDRLYRFVGWSTAFHLTVAPVTYMLWRGFLAADQWRTGGWELLLPWTTLLIYMLLPIVAGRRVGGSWKQGRAWARALVGDPAPSSWDHVWSNLELAWVRVRMKSGGWIGGAYGTGEGLPSYAAGHPNPADLYLAQTYEVDERVLGHGRSWDTSATQRWYLGSVGGRRTA